MKSTGVVRRLDNLGRIVIPIEIRKALRIDLNDELEIYTKGDQVVLKKYECGCIFCGETRNLAEYRDKPVCRKCLDEMKEF